MAKLPIGPRRVVATPDLSGNNTGNWTCAFDPATVASHWTIYEVYKMVVNIDPGAGVVPFTVYVGLHQYEAFQASAVASWADPIPMSVSSGETLYFYFSEPTSDGTPPSVTIWLQVDLDIAQRTG